MSKFFLAFACAAAAFCLAFGGPGVPDALGQVRAVQLAPPPNYGSCQDQQAVQELTDGVLGDYPLWVRPGCVGWQDSGPVRILLHVDTGQNSVVSGNLSIHTARGESAGVEIPCRIDVYYLGSDQLYRHAAGETLQTGSFADGQDHWVSIPVANVTGDLLLVVRPTGSYFMTDEIGWAPGAVASSAPPDLVGNMDACVADSTQRYRSSLLNTTVPADIASGWAAAFGSAKLKTWVADNPWDALPVYPAAGTIALAAPNVHLCGTKSDVESACIGILNLDLTNRTIVPSFAGESKVISSLSIRQVSKILAANGSIVYDPLVPLSGGRLSAMPRQASYLWVQADLRTMDPGLHSVSLSIRDGSNALIATIPFSFFVTGAKLLDSRRPAAVNWGYTNDLPIWNHPDKCMADLTDHGINVFVVNPSFIPQPSLDGRWNDAAAQALADQLALFRGRGAILLYLNWGPGGIAPRWLAPSNPQTVTANKDALASWLKRLAAFVKAQQVDVSQWALYPMDEPCGGQMPFLLELVKCFKQADPAVRIYENPTSYSSCATTSADLANLQPYIDLWQPPLATAIGALSGYFSNLSRPWWVYSNPPSPAKAASPWEDYLLKVVKAWAAGAKGVGFWSYSDTSGTSAWNDLDGRRPDFAVVYEGTNGPVGSRRWEAFRKGVEDFQLLESVKDMDLPSSGALAAGLRSRVVSILALQPVPFAAVESLRRDLLGAGEDSQPGAPANLHIWRSAPRN